MARATSDAAYLCRLLSDEAGVIDCGPLSSKGGALRRRSSPRPAWRAARAR